MEPLPAQASESDHARSPPLPLPSPARLSSSLAAGISSPLAVICSFWKDFDLEKERIGLNEQGLKIVENQYTSDKNKRKIVENTQDFKKASPHEKFRLFNSLLKSYQEEVENLKKRAKFGENAFLNIYQKLYEAPDPYPALASIADQDQKLSQLETENCKMKLELEEYRAETAHLNQQATIRRLEERNHQLEQQKQVSTRLMEEEPPAAASFPDDILVEIFSRLPFRSLCRFKCVSRSWHDLISHPHHRKKLPQTLVGFFYKSKWDERSPVLACHFTNFTRKDMSPSLSFMPFSNNDLVLLDSCGGLLLFCYFLQPAGARPCDPYLFHGFNAGPRDGAELPPFRYVVCNPATEKWVMLSEGSCAAGEARTARLCFDPTFSPHFHVIEFVDSFYPPCTHDYIDRLDIYSSKTGSWSSVECGWDDPELILERERSVFLNGFLHSVAIQGIVVAVDMEGKTWREIPVPATSSTYEFVGIDRAQGRLCFTSVHEDDKFKLSVWILEDYDTDNWILKHTVSTSHLFGMKGFSFDDGCWGIAIHPEGNVIFFIAGCNDTLMAYRMDSREVRVICDLGGDSLSPYLPYVPFFGVISGQAT